MDLKRGKTQVTKSRLVLVLHLIGWGGASFFKPIPERSEVKPLQSWITFDTQLKIALFINIS